MESPTHLPSASIIVLSWNGERFLQPCLQAVLAQTDDTVEVFVVDNASTDDSVAIAKNFAPRVRLIQNEINLGFAGGNNVGIKAATGEVVILLNQDTVVQPGWLAAILETFTDPAIGIVGCKALYPDGKTVQHAGARVKPGDAFTEHIGLGQMDEGQFDHFADADYVTGASFAIHRRVLERLGGLDEDYYPAFYEEVDYCYRARRAGFRVVYQPRAVFYHYETASMPTRSLARERILHRNRLRFVLRHWEAAALETLRFTELPSLALQGWSDDDIVARAEAYFGALLELPNYSLQRRIHQTLGPALTASEQLDIFDSLQDLRQSALKRLAENIATLADDVANNQVTESDWSRLQDLLNGMEARHPPIETVILASPVPVIGPLVTQLRAWLLSTFVRPYVVALFSRQWHYNAQVEQILLEVVRKMEHQAKLQQRQGELLGRQVNILSADDAALLKILRQQLDDLASQRAE